MPGFSSCCSLTLADVGGDAAKVAALYIGIDVVDRLNIRLVYTDWNAVRSGSRRCLSSARVPASVSVAIAVEMGVLLSAFKRVDVIFRGLNREIVGDSVARIGPEIRGDLFRGAEADIDIVVTAGAMRPTCRARDPVHLRIKVRRIQFLLKMGVGNTGNFQPCGAGAPLLPRTLVGRGRGLGHGRRSAPGARN